jgi:hypothetical protein
MPYLNLDDNYPDHPKVEALSDAAFRLHTASMAFCAKFTTDGFISQSQAAKRTSSYKGTVIQELLRGGLWHDKGEGCGTKTCPPGRAGFYLLHDYLQWNKSKDWWEKKRRKDAERLANWRANHASGETDV